MMQANQDHITQVKAECQKAQQTALGKLNHELEASKKAFEAYKADQEKMSERQKGIAVNIQEGIAVNMQDDGSSHESEDAEMIPYEDTLAQLVK